MDQHYFPIHTYFAGEIEPEQIWPLTFMQPALQGLHYGYPFDDSYQSGVFVETGIVDMLMCIAASELSDDVDRGIYQRMLGQYPSLNQIPPSFKLTAILRQLAIHPPEPPFGGLLQACQLVLHETGNLWLDMSADMYYEGGYGYETWDQADVASYLSDQWQAAQQLLAASRQLAAICDDRDVAVCKQRQQQVVRLLNGYWQMYTSQLILPLTFEH